MKEEICFFPSWTKHNH